MTLDTACARRMPCGYIASDRERRRKLKGRMLLQRFQSWPSLHGPKKLPFSRLCPCERPLLEFLIGLADLECAARVLTGRAPSIIPIADARLLATRAASAIMHALAELFRPPVGEQHPWFDRTYRAELAQAARWRDAIHDLDFALEGLSGVERAARLASIYVHETQRKTP